MAHLVPILSKILLIYYGYYADMLFVCGGVAVIKNMTECPSDSSHIIAI
jgi:hypothetical protein